MSNGGRIPAPDFDGTKYERPNNLWLCGHTCEGCPCRVGPSPDGKCRATTECKPRLVVPEGQGKGTWKCTRPKEWGGPCATGPMPDGTCCRPITACLPVRSLRGKRGVVVRATVMAAIAVLLVGLSGAVSESFINPAPLSVHHSNEEFASAGKGQGCALCHADAGKSFPALVTAAVKAAGTSLPFEAFVTPHPKDFSRMDRSCLKCHTTRSFHQAPLPTTPSCSVCHREHQGAGRMAPVADIHCTTCHGDQGEMLAGANKGRRLPPAELKREPKPGLVFADIQRPAEGFTKIITNFPVNHPEFQLLREKTSDKTVLKFNHKKHQDGEIPVLNGKPLECISCHRPDASGLFMQRISFEQNCRACHVMSFDETQADLTLPHGNPAMVRDYLRNLPERYAKKASGQPGLTEPGAVAAFAEKQIAALRERNGGDLEKAIFLGESKSGLTGDARAKAVGCAFCHEVTPRENALPAIVPPRVPDRWFTHARFDHAAHGTMNCADCHEAAKSEKTSDVLIPAQQSCVQCHSPKGGAMHNCRNCHTYHNTAPDVK